MSKSHQKHAFLQKPNGGQYHRNEWTIIGAPCSVIKELVENLSSLLDAEGLRTGYLDMEHKEQELDSRSATIMTDKLNHVQWNSRQTIHQRDYRKYFNDLDLLFVNGNHYKGQKQIVIIDPKKKDSLQRKIDRLDDVQLIIKNGSEVYDFLFDLYDQQTPIIELDNIELIKNFILSSYKKDVPPLYGLVLAGGKSSRMGEDKAAINYHGTDQSIYEAKLLEKFCDETFISGSKISDSNFATIEDSFVDLGPYGGILSAFRHNPNTAWLSLACDLPYLDEDTLGKLVTARNVRKLATCFYNPETDFPEPLITIWEPRAYPVLLDFLSQGYSCPRKVLINCDIEMIKMDDPIRMKNSNTPEEKKEALRFIAGHDK